MTIEIDGGYAQWDYQIGTFRADIGGVVYGLYTADIMHPTEFPFVLTDEQIAALLQEKEAAE